MEDKIELSQPGDLYSHIPQVKLDDEGRFKYILINVEFPQEGETLEFVRGYLSCAYHANILDKFNKEEMQNSNIFYKGKSIVEATEVSCPGGGRIIHGKEKKELAIYGYSVSFGQGDHNRVVDILKKHLDYEEESFKISFSGY